MDAPKAIAARGFSPTVTGAVTILLGDPLLPHNSGPNGFAALYAGTPVHILRTAGLASGGGPAEDELLDRAFASRPAYLLGTSRTLRSFHHVDEHPEM